MQSSARSNADWRFFYTNCLWIFFPFPDYDIEHMVGETDQQSMLTPSSPKPPRVKTYQEITLLWREKSFRFARHRTFSCIWVIILWEIQINKCIYLEQRNIYYDVRACMDNINFEQYGVIEKPAFIYLF